MRTVTAQEQPSYSNIDSIVFATLGMAAKSIGKPDFYSRLLAALCGCVPHDLSGAIRYSLYSKPEMLLGEGYSPQFFAAYTRDFYRYDPFYRYWKEVERPAVVSLSDVVKTTVDRNRYVNTILADINVADEIGLFLPAVGRSSIALFVHRQEPFAPEHLRAAKDVYGLLAALHSAHLNCIVGNPYADEEGVGGALVGPNPTCVLDRGGDAILRNRAWEAFAAENDETLAAALAKIEPGGQVRLGPRLTLHRAPVPLTFHLAPGGMIDVIEPVGLTPIALDDFGLPGEFSDALSKREQEVVELILQGFPTTRIAKHLGLTPGTVKNYRRRIYQKLDITTEREIFLNFIAALRDGGRPPGAEARNDERTLLMVR